MKNFFNVLTAALFTLAATGCSYSDPDIYFADPIPGDSAIVVVSTNLDTMDRVVITDSLLFKYRAEITGGELYLTQARLEDQTLYLYVTDYDSDTIIGSYVLSDSFWIMQDLNLGTGINTLQFSIYYSSNTNSLADMMGVEASTLDLEYPIVLEGGDK